MKGELSVSLCSSASCSSEASSALKETSSLLLLAKERSRDWSCSPSRRTSVFLWLLPTWTFRPRCESDVKSQWSHLNFLAPVLWSEGVEEIAACSSISLLGGSPFSTTKRWWKAKSFSRFLLPPFFFFFFLLAEEDKEVEEDRVEVVVDVVHCSVAKTFPLLCFSRREHSFPCFTILSQHETRTGSTQARVTSMLSSPGMVDSDVYLN